jgi:hypothetical protein
MASFMVLLPALHKTSPGCYNQNTQQAHALAQHNSLTLHLQASHDQLRLAAAGCGNHCVTQLVPTCHKLTALAAACSSPNSPIVENNPGTHGTGQVADDTQQAFWLQGSAFASFSASYFWSKQPESVHTLPEAKTNCGGAHLWPKSNADTVVRCLLELPTTGGSESERANTAKEVKCWRCGLCNDKTGTGCPSELGAWYCDVYAINADGCGFDRAKGWGMQMARMVVSPQFEAQVVKFEVCSDPGCFDQAYEAEKLAKALPCSRKSC